MDQKTLFLILIVLIGWGGGAILEKFATNRLGANPVIFWNVVGYAIVSVIFVLFLLKPQELFAKDPMGIVWALVSGVVGAIGGIAYFMLLANKDASMVVPATAIYPAVTAVLAFIFLRESLTLTKIIGIILATVAVYLLSVS